MTEIPARQLIDCCVVDDEIELLEARIRYLAPYVDAFVVVEARVDFRGRRKPAYIERSGMLLDYANVHHIVLDDLPSVASDEQAAAWERDAAQRNAIRCGLIDFNPEDVAIVCDIDEFPSPAALAFLRSARLESTVRLEMRHSIMYANLATRHAWPFPYAIPVRLLKSTHATRFHPQRDDALLHDGGWHLSYLGRAGAMRGKLGKTAHTELDRTYLKSSSHLRICSFLGAHPASTFKMLDWYDPNELPSALLDGWIGAHVLERRSALKKWVAAAYSGGVSLAVDENWRVRALRDRVRSVARSVRRRRRRASTSSC